MRCYVVGPHHELNLGRAYTTEPIFQRAHHGRAEAFFTTSWVNGEVIDPASMAVEADHGGGG